MLFKLICTAYVLSVQPYLRNGHRRFLPNDLFDFGDHFVESSRLFNNIVVVDIDVRGCQ